MKLVRLLCWIIYFAVIITAITLLARQAFAVEDPWNSGGQPSEITPAPPIIQPPGACQSKVDGKCLPFPDDENICNEHVSAAMITYVREHGKWADCAEQVNTYNLGLYLFGYMENIRLHNTSRYEEPKWLGHTFVPFPFCARQWLYWKEQIDTIKQHQAACLVTVNRLMDTISATGEKDRIYFVANRLGKLLGY